MKVAENTQNNQIITYNVILSLRTAAARVSAMCFHHVYLQQLSAYQPTCSNRALQWNPLSRRRRQLEMERPAAGMGGVGWESTAVHQHDQRSSTEFNFVIYVLSFFGLPTILQRSEKMVEFLHPASQRGRDMRSQEHRGLGLGPMANLVKEASQKHWIRYPQQLDMENRL